MFLVGILLATIMMFSKVFDTLLNKKFVDNYDPIQHSINRIVIVIPILLIASLPNWMITSQALWMLLLYSLFDATNILFHQSSLKYLNPHTADALSKSKVVMVLIFSIALGISKINLPTIIGVLVFFTGLVFVVDYSKKGSEETKKSSILGIFLQVLSVFSRSVKPFIIKEVLVNNLASNETMVFLSMPIALILLMAIFRKKPSINRNNIKLYTIQGVFVALSMILMGYAVLYSNAVAVAVIESFSIIVLILISFILYKKKQSPKVILGVLLATIGAIIFVFVT